MFAMIVLTNALDAQLDDCKIESDPVKRSVQCSHGWTPLNGRCFRYIPRPMSWAKAEKNCLSMRGNLASVHDIEEYHEIQRLILTSGHEYKQTWIGGTDAQEENQWFWSDGTPFHFTNWCSGEPSNTWNIHGNQHCLQMNYGYRKCWDDLQCSYPRPSLCAIKGN
ncbi:PREDICTED: type-2 ice-structuring protein-like [Cyprinodon variegatus]|uniref:type-2 ice-structuring protein-like n=1 Tax=Cyprinodon variegatus TaxID=28743 RepID=UPI0007425A5F|nr:PREDICTED: type-2 ice-structuring protein-like [Cyprinodon variegatus]